jgi:hypothetical protein
MARKKKNTEPFIMLFREVIKSHAWRALSNGARMVIYRVAEEWMAHGGTIYTDLPVPQKDFIEFGLHNHAIAPGQREACALGLLMLTTRGRAGNAEFRAPHKWALAFIKDRQGKYLGTDWHRFKSLEEAKEVAQQARAFRDTNAVAMGRKRAEKRRLENRTPVSSHDTETSVVPRHRKLSKAG